ncbi:UDP-glucose/GDP-mannose dehydrogenase family protein [Sinomonas sp. ASV322]|uniref:UDP-glucose dehydrogenase family protein n=1 Tax=Sinomonas sp. ASV322 TaxID=3041920 RepID=UPI0027DC6578|nr:UDP-glucose/GDP-mannose dehydrogenase family protein [Sinomonas sp. ASV322]MDQ4504198.1 UDP-glucose/GDP-mannose dehydrogenase family protein [Sinomonas sp. ASV322]
MKISVIGCGYLGAVHAATLASMGHDVVGVDTDAEKVGHLARGFAPFFEPGLEDLLRDGRTNNRLTFSTDMDLVADCDVHFLCVGTPQSKTSELADLAYVEAATRALAEHAKAGSVVVGKSTVPVGTVQRVRGWLAGTSVELAWNPEFLRQGTAVKDSLVPDRLVYGVDDADLAPGAQAASAVVRALDEVYAPLLHAGVPRIVCNFATAELIKSAANAYLATKLSYINAMAELCDAAGADVTQLSAAMGLDPRIGQRYLAAGLGFGGGCLPKDIRSFRAQARELGVDSVDAWMGLVDEININQRTRVAEVAAELCGGSVSGRRVAVLGAAFKPDTDDIRDSPAIDVSLRLAEAGAHVIVTDPKAINNAWMRYPQLQFETSVAAACDGAEIVLLVTEWAEFRAVDPVELVERVARPVMVDARNVLDADAWRAAGWTFRGLGTGEGARRLSDVQAG